MVITKFMGGLGNQMFQYALAKHLAILTKSQVFIDLSFLNVKNPKNYTYRPFEIGHFKIQENIASEKLLAKFENRNRKQKTLEFDFKNYFKIQEKTFEFDDDILKLKGNVHLTGYWQSEKYFQNIESIIRKEFTLKNEHELLENKFYKQIIKSENSVAVHVRRGDYVQDAKTNAHHGTCSLEYYQNAILHFKKKFPEVQFYVFSDDLAWCKANFKFENMIFVEGNLAYLDLVLMSKCQYQIMANSSFSWWGTWLNTNPQKMAIAPKTWFRDKKCNTKDLYSKDWILLDNE